MRPHTISTSFSVGEHRAVISCENLKDLEFFTKRMGLSGSKATTLLLPDKQNKEAAKSLAEGITRRGDVTTDDAMEAQKGSLLGVYSTPTEVIVFGIVNAVFQRDGDSKFSFDTRHGSADFTVKDEEKITTSMIEGQESFLFHLTDQETGRILTGAVLLG